MITTACQYHTGLNRQVALASIHTRHIKNFRVVCRRHKLLYDVFPHLFLIHFLLSNHLYCSVDQTLRLFGEYLAILKQFYDENVGTNIIL